MTAASVSEIAAAFPWFFPVVAFMFGACIGSFLNVVIYRLPKNESIVTPGSHCGCGQPIQWRDNIPMLSWVLLRGRARCCGRPFSFRYPSVELLTALLFVACWLTYGTSPAVAICGMIFISALVAATFIDLDHFIIPDAFTLGLGATGLLLSLAFPALHGQNSGNFLQDSVRSGLLSLIGSCVGSALVLWISVVAEAVLKKQAMGFGDVKFVGGIGAFCGWQGAIFTLFGGAVVGTVWFLVAWLWQRTSGKASPVAPPVEKPQEEDIVPPFGWFEAFSLGAGVIGVGASFLVPALHGPGRGVFMIDSVNSGITALMGLLIGSGIVLWFGLLIEVLVKKDLIPLSVVQLAGAIGSLSLWSQGILGVLRGALLAAAAGGIACALWWTATRLQKKLAAQPPAEAPAAEITDEPPALGFGVHVPFGPMLAIAAAGYFLFFHPFVRAWLAEVAQLLV